MRLTLADSSVVVGAISATDVHHASASAALLAVAEGELAVSVITYSEVMVGAFRTGGSFLATVQRFFEEMPSRIEPASREIAHRAAQLRARHTGLRLVDALIISTGEVLDVDRILTGNESWTGVSRRVAIV